VRAIRRCAARLAVVDEEETQHAEGGTDRHAEVRRGAPRRTRLPVRISTAARAAALREDTRSRDISRMPTPSLKTHPDTGLLVLRLGLGALLLFHGIYKATHGVAWIAGPLAKHGLPAWLMYGVYIAEIVAPVMVIFGLWTRIAALIIAFDMVMAIYLARWADIGKVNPMGGSWAIEVEAMYLIMALTLALAGGGRYGLTKS
jgi:putative oxidoreductase